MPDGQRIHPSAKNGPNDEAALAPVFVATRQHRGRMLAIP
jgi:hypothetical protein